MWGSDDMNMDLMLLLNDDPRTRITMIFNCRDRTTCKPSIYRLSSYVDIPRSISDPVNSGLSRKLSVGRIQRIIFKRIHFVVQVMGRQPFSDFIRSKFPEKL